MKHSMINRLTLLLLIGLLNAPAASVSFYERAEDQLNFLWRSIEKTAYSILPPITPISIADSLTLLRPSFNSDAFIGDHCIMSEGRKKIIHASGTAIKVSYVVLRRAYSGIFAHGAPHGLLRLSLAEPPANDSYKPGFGLMLFVDQNPPVTILATPGLDGQLDPNLLRFDYTTVLAPPKASLKMCLLERQFTKGLAQAGFSHHDGRALSTTDFVRGNHDGTMEVSQKAPAPFELIFSPTPETTALLDGIKAGDDFREILAAKGNGFTLFDVLARRLPDSQLEHIGKIIATSGFVASLFGDTKLRIKHPAPMEKFRKKRSCFCRS